MSRRAGLPLLLVVMVVACAPLGSRAGGPGLWAGQVITLEDEGYRLSDQQRAERAWQKDRGVMDAWLAGEAAVLGQEVAVCPEAGLAAEPASRARERDGVRARVQADAARAGLAHAAARARLQLAAQRQALAGWLLRRAAATGDARQCDAARVAAQGADQARGDGPLVLDSAAAPPGAPRVAVRLHTVEAVPLLLALRVGAVPLTLVDVGAGNPAARVGADAEAALASADDLAASGRADLADVYRVYDRAPVAVAALPPASAPALAPLVLAQAEPKGALAASLAHALETAAAPPRLVGGTDPLHLLGWYATGAVDGVLAQAPLPQYLAAHYGGTVVWDAAEDQTSQPVAAASLLLPTGADPGLRQRLVDAAQRGARTLRASAPEDLVESLAADYPDWEPDAVLAALRVAARCSTWAAPG